MSDIPRDPIGTADSYHANITINAPIDTVFAAVFPVAGLSGWWTTDTGGSPEPGGQLRFPFSDGTAVMRVEERTPPAVERAVGEGCASEPGGQPDAERRLPVHPAARRRDLGAGCRRADRSGPPAGR